MAPALHSTKYLLSILQHVLIDQRSPRLRLNKLVKQTLREWVSIAQEIALHPVPLASMVPMPPTLIGATDASKEGMGSFWAPTTLSPPQHQTHGVACSFQQQGLLTASNLNGSLMNSDLELAALVTGAAVATANTTTSPSFLLCATDNIIHQRCHGPQKDQRL